MKDFIITELNKTAALLGLDNRVRFYNSDAVKVAQDFVPYGKIAGIYSKTSFESFGREMTNRLKRAGIKPLNFIMPENAVLNLKNVFDVICVPDDVRAVMVFDNELTDIAAYIATLFAIPVILTLNTVSTDRVLPVKVPFFWGVSGLGADLFSADCAYHVIISDDALINSDRSEQYMNVYGKLLALYDYRLKLAVSGGQLPNDICKTVADAVNAVNSSCDAETLLTSGLKAELANLSAGGKIIFNSAEYCFKRLIGFKKTSGTLFALIKKLIALYALCVSENDMPFEVPDYNKRAEELSDLTKSDEGVFLKGFLAQIKAIRVKTLSALKSEFKDEIVALAEDFKIAEQNYIKLGGNLGADFSPYVKALKLCGDLPDTLNFMTIVRESGFTEFI